MQKPLDRNNPVPLYYQLAQILREQIESGVLSQGEQLPSESEMIAQYGVGRLTVRNALAQLVNEHYVQKVHGKGTFVNYARPTSPSNVDVLLDVSYTYFAANYIQSISHVLTAENCNFIISDTKDSQGQICNILERILSKGSAGVIFQPAHAIEPASERLRGLLTQLLSRNIPYLMIDRAYNVPGPYLVVDEYRGGQIAAEHLTGLGHRRIAMVQMADFQESVPRQQGFEAILKEASCPPLTVIPCDGELAQTLLPRIREEGLTALFCFNDEVAVDCLRILREAGVRVPEEISVVGYDDSLIAAAAVPPLTTVVHPKAIMGERAARKILRLIARDHSEPPAEMLSPKLMARASTAAPNR